jgi:spore maturation protein CgeB
MKIFVFGSSIVSSYWNGAATYYRGIYKYLHLLGNQITFAEPDAYGRQQKLDAAIGDYVEVIVYPPEKAAELIQQACEADLVIKHSGVGINDELLEGEVLQCHSERTRVAFWDVDAPATLSRVESDAADPFRRCIPRYDLIFTYGGGDAVVQHYTRLGARNCHPIYNALDPASHHPVPPKEEFSCDLLFVGHRLPDRERRVEEFFLRAAELAPDRKFILGGEGWGDKKLPANVRWIGHVGTGDHNVLNCSARMVLNVNRASMADVGFSPPTRIFEAAGAGACLITDSWNGISAFFVPGQEILVASSAEDVVSHLFATSAPRARALGEAMRQRALRDHTYEQRALQVQSVLSEEERLSEQAA